MGADRAGTFAEAEGEVCWAAVEEVASSSVPPSLRNDPAII
jgi:hypothetical protein